MSQYIYKGPDRATVSINGETAATVNPRDEVQLYLDARYVSSIEAYARSMGWATHRVRSLLSQSTMSLTLIQEFPPVSQLQVHLENEQCVTFKPNGRLGNIKKDSQLMGFFKANKKYPDARMLYYHEFPSRFVWKKDLGEWVPRQRQTAFGRLVYIPPNAGEKFYARLILSVVKNLQSFDDLRTVDGILFETIREACLARGLLEDDGEWRRSLDEAKNFQTGYILRALFVVIIRDCIPADPQTLWQQYKAFLCDDLARVLTRLGIHNASDDIVEDYGLYLIEQILMSASNKTMKDVGMNPPSRDWVSLLSNPLMHEHLQFDAAQEERYLLEVWPLLNDDQRIAFDRIMNAVLSDQKETFFVVGAAGAGKTFLYKTLCHTVRSHSLVVLCVAYSGIAAQLLPGGRTAHSMFKIPFEILDDSMCSIPKNSSLAEVLKSATLLIWDECSAQHRYAFEAVDRTLRDLRDSNELFGGIPTVLGGDFLQTLPVVKGNLRSPIVHACLLSSPLWTSIKRNVLKLEKNMRVGPNAEDQAFATWLRQLASGTLNADDQTVALPPNIVFPSHAVADLITHVYPGITKKQPDSYFRERCLLAPRNSDTGDINADVLRMFPGEEHELWAVDHALDPTTLLEDDTNYSPEVLHSYSPSGFPLARLSLKVGCPVMILRNLQPREGVCNGSRGIVTRISTRILEVRLFNGATVLIPRIKMISADPDLPFKLRRLQFPVSLSFAMTINKSQGQTFDVVGVDLRNPVFSHGQLYVALSRARHLSSLKCITSEFHGIERTKNVVFKEVVI